MCEYSGKLIAWLDRELPDEEATNVEWHLGQCAECRQALSAYEEVSGAFLACYETSCPHGALGVHLQAKASVWDKASVWMMSGLAAAAILAAILLIPPRTEKLPLYVPHPPRAPQIGFEQSPAEAPIVRASSRRNAAQAPVASPVRLQWIAVEPTVEVALPAEALFPPGAVPPGFSFIADVRP
jgi:anti-sigma factor RsiW